MMPGSYCNITIYGDGQWVRFEAALDRDFINEVKKIPAYSRSGEKQRFYDSSKQSWMIAPEFYERVLAIAKRCYKRITVYVIGSEKAIEFQGDKAI